MPPVPAGGTGGHRSRGALVMHPRVPGATWRGATAVTPPKIHSAVPTQARAGEQHTPCVLGLICREIFTPSFALFLGSLAARHLRGGRCPSVSGCSF